MFAAEARQVAVAHVIGKDKQDVGLLGSSLFGGDSIVFSG